MNTRIKELRKCLGLTQQDFANKLNIKRGTIANYEIGRNIPIDAVVSLICKEFNVNEKWLRSGEGEMFSEDEDEFLFRWVGSVLKDTDSIKKRYLKLLSSFSDDDWKVLAKLFNLDN